MNKEQIFSTEWLGRTLTIKTGKLALQANASVTVQYGDTVVLATVVESKTQREGIDYSPLMVEFEERFYAAGIIKGSRWIKREGRPSDDAVLTGRMIDRTIRPLFDDSSRNDTQVVLTLLSADNENNYDVISLIAASAVLSISGINWNGPIAGVRVGRVDGKLIFNPTYKQTKQGDLDLIVAGTDEKVIQIEAGANEVNEDDMFYGCNLVDNEDGFKPAYYTFQLLFEKLGTYRTVNSLRDDHIHLYAFTNPDGALVYVGWSDTKQQVNLKNFINAPKVVITHIVEVRGQNKPQIEQAPTEKVPLSPSPVFITLEE